MRTTLILLGLALVGGLRVEGDRIGQASAASARQGGSAETAQARYMRPHLNQAIVVHDAVIRGDLNAARQVAQELAALDTGRFPKGDPEAIAAMKAAASRASVATDALTAGRATAEMLSACGQCHLSLGTRPAIPTVEGPNVGGVVGHMLQHQRVTDALLEGLVVPSDTLWRAGARALMTDPLNPRQLPVDDAVRRQLAPTEVRLHRLATDAIQATDQESRADYYGQILAGCADCHQLHAKIWGPKPKR